MRQSRKSSAPRPVPVRAMAGLLCAMFAALSLLCAPGATAEPPSRMGPQVVDAAEVLSGADEAGVLEAVDRLYRDHQVKLWVIYVRNFAAMAPRDWAARTAELSGFSDRDLLLAVAVDDRGYWLHGVLPDAVSDGELDALLAGTVEPDLRDREWAQAGIDTADGIGSAMRGASVPWGWLVGIGLVVVVGAGGLILFSRKRRRDQDRAELSTAREVDPADSGALAKLSLPTLQALSRERLVEIDDAVRTSAEELALATSEFGETAVTPFRTALDAARAATAKAFTIRQQLDDAVPETPDQQRSMLIDLISTAGRADRELDTQVTDFDAMRDLLIDAPARLDGLTRDIVDLTARQPASEAELARLNSAYPASVLAPIHDNVRMAAERMTFAEQNIDTARTALTRPVGQQGGAVAAIRAAEGAIGQARTLLDAVDQAATNIQQARDGLPAALDELRADLAAAAALTEYGGPELAAAVGAATTTVSTAAARVDADPLGAFHDAVTADAELDRAIAAASDRKLAVEDLRRRLDRTLTDAAGRVDAASSFITTRRGGVDAEARTRLSEAQRHLDEARRLAATAPDRALVSAQTAADLGGRALEQAQASVRAWESRQPMAGGSQAGAVLGGILLDGFLRGSIGGATRRGGGGFGGGGGYRPGSYGGSSGSRRVSRGGRF